MPSSIEFDGVADMRRRLKEMGDVEATREFKTAGYDAAAKVVVPRAQGRAAALGAMQSKAASTLKPIRVATGGAVRYGGGLAFAMGAEFGAAQDQLRNTSRGTVRGWNQFDPWRGSGEGAGYFLWPTIRDDNDQIVEEFAEGFDRLATRLGWD